MTHRGLFQPLPFCDSVKQRMKRLLLLWGHLSPSKPPLEGGRKAHSSPLLPHAGRAWAAVPWHGSARPASGQLWRGLPCVEGFTEGGQTSSPCLLPGLWGNHFCGVSKGRRRRFSMASTECVQDANTFLLFCFTT